MEDVKYGKLLDRMKAVIIDMLVLVGMSLITSLILSNFENVPDSLRLILFVLIFLLYDPTFTSFIGGTIGHLLLGLRIRDSKDESRRIFFPLAIIRFIFKTLLGAISLLTVTGNTKNKAIHDSLVGSVVIKY